MKKAIQEQYNRIVDAYLFRYQNRPLRDIGIKKLRSCAAEVIEQEDMLTGQVIYALRSYNTIVAVIDGRDAYDFLRKVYGYTATSAQHIAKFYKDYSPAYHDRAYLVEHTWRPV